jgi:N-acetyl-anhydromuramyl-L-alanine amidase AmpD
MLNVIPYGNFKPLGKNKKKKQIILCHTSREVDDYLTSLSFRYNSKYDRIPHYVISREGRVMQLLPDTTYSNFMWDVEINKNSIIVVLENLGWLEKKPLSSDHLNWIGNIYKQGVFEKKWRDYYLWQPYTTSQMENTYEICSKIAEDNSIDKKFIGHNTKIEGAEKYEGIICRSNFDSSYTDLSPAFDFGYLQKKFDHEQYTSREI